MEDDEPGTPEELLALLEAAHLGPRQRHTWVYRPSALLSGLVPAEAITDPATAARARRAVRRLIARLPNDPVPDGVHVTAARILEPGTYRVELDFAWPDGTARRHIDLEPILNALSGPVFEPIRNDYDTFARLHVSDGTLAWPGEVDLAPELLYSESWLPRE